MADRATRTKKSQFSLDGLKEARAGGVSRLDQLEVTTARSFIADTVDLRLKLQLEDEGDVYEMVDEEEYASLVERRRNEDDFVVDDSKIYHASMFGRLRSISLRVFVDGLGYHDDGEEHLGVGEDVFDGE